MSLPPAGVDLSGIQKLIAQYPTLWAQYKNHPDIVKVLADAANGSWSQQQLQEAMMQTPYWKTTTEAQRQWDIVAATEPAEAQKRQQAAIQAMANVSQRLGIDPANRGNQYGSQTQNFLADLWHVTSQDLNEAQIGDYLVSKYWNQNPNAATGEIAANMGQIRGVFADYALPSSPHTEYHNALQLSLGHTTLDQIKGDAAAQAQGLYAPEVGKAISEGKTVAQWAAPYTNLAAQTLEISPDTIDLSQPKWQKFLKAPPDATGQSAGGPAKGDGGRAMTTSEWQATIRTDPTYGFDHTANARQSAAQLANQIQTKFGEQ